MSESVGAGPAMQRLTTPRAAAWAGVLFALFFGVSLVLFRTTIPANPFADPRWATDGATRLRIALTLVPFAGISFLWFVGVVRDRLGEYEDRFLSSIMVGSALLFLAMVFVSSAIAAGILVTARTQHDLAYAASFRFSRVLMLQISNVYALRMAGTFMSTLGTIWLRTRVMPRWLGALTYGLAIALWAVSTFSLWTTLIFPGWVLGVSVLFLARSYAVGHAEST